MKRNVKAITAESVPDVPELETIYTRVSAILDEVRNQTVRSINTLMVTAYWLTGREIVEAEQGGKSRAPYGTNLLEDLSVRLTARFGKGFSETNLKYFRDFYITYRERLTLSETGEKKKTAKKSHTVCGELPLSVPERVNGHTLCAESAPSFHPDLGWSHYRTLMRVEKPEARTFYEQEAAKAHWSVRELERQIGSLYYERLLMSRERKEMLCENRRPAGLHPLDVIKDPYVLEFLNLPEDHRLNETDLEERLIENLQAFLLELGHGFAFIGRQQRLTLDGDHFYADLVFYHVRLKCYIVIDLKTQKLTHADLGQMQLYVGFYDENVKGKDDNPTLGLILCTDKNDAVIRYVLGKGQDKIFASRYRLELPSEAELAAEMRREMKLLGMDDAKRSRTNPQIK